MFAKNAYTGLTLPGMERMLTPAEAWHDFFAWIKTQENWADIPRTEKQYLYKADSDLAKCRLGQKRIRGILRKYAPDRYEFVEGVVVRG